MILAFCFKKFSRKMSENSKPFQSKPKTSEEILFQKLANFHTILSERQEMKQKCREKEKWEETIGKIHETLNNAIDSGLSEFEVIIDDLTRQQRDALCNKISALPNISVGWYVQAARGKDTHFFLIVRIEKLKT